MDLRHRPTHDWLIGRKIHAPEEQEAPIIHGIVRVGHKPPHHYARIEAIGPGRVHPQTGFTPGPVCAVGDVVMVRAVAGDLETIEGVEYFWFMPDEILAVVPAA